MSLSLFAGSRCERNRTRTIRAGDVLRGARSGVPRAARVSHRSRHPHAHRTIHTALARVRQRRVQRHLSALVGPNAHRMPPHRRHVRAPVGGTERLVFPSLHLLARDTTGTRTLRTRVFPERNAQSATASGAVGQRFESSVARQTEAPRIKADSIGVGFECGSRVLTSATNPNVDRERPPPMPSMRPPPMPSLVADNEAVDEWSR